MDRSKNKNLFVSIFVKETDQNESRNAGREPPKRTMVRTHTVQAARFIFILRNCCASLSTVCMATMKMREMNTCQKWNETKPGAVARCIRAYSIRLYTQRARIGKCISIVVVGCKCSTFCVADAFFFRFVLFRLNLVGWFGSLISVGDARVNVLSQFGRMYF